MLRAAVGATSLVLGLLALWLGFRVRDGNYHDFFLNLGTEIMGIGLTVLAVEWLFEKHQARENARRIALRALHRLDHAVWVWQGGRRELDVAELMALLDLADPADPLPSFTQNLLLVLGSDAEDTLRHEPEAVRSCRHLREACGSLATLARMRDRDEAMTPSEILPSLRLAAEHLAAAAGLAIPPADRDSAARTRNPSFQKQEWRHFGRTFGEAEGD